MTNRQEGLHMLNKEYCVPLKNLVADLVQPIIARDEV